MWNLLGNSNASISATSCRKLIFCDQQYQILLISLPRASAGLGVFVQGEGQASKRVYSFMKGSRCGYEQGRFLCCYAVMIILQGRTAVCVNDRRRSSGQWRRNYQCWKSIGNIVSLFANLLILNRLWGVEILCVTASVLLFLCMSDGHLSPACRVGFFCCDVLYFVESWQQISWLNSAIC